MVGSAAAHAAEKVHLIPSLCFNEILTVMGVEKVLLRLAVGNEVDKILSPTY